MRISLSSSIFCSFCVARLMYCLSSSDGLKDFSRSIGSNKYRPSSVRIVVAIGVDVVVVTVIQLLHLGILEYNSDLVGINEFC